VLRTNISHLKKQLETEQHAHEECKLEVEKLRDDLEETRAKDPVLADQIKVLMSFSNPGDAMLQSK
jgi:regulator of replication initiation timing